MTQLIELLGGSGGSGVKLSACLNRLACVATRFLLSHAAVILTVTKATSALYSVTDLPVDRVSSAPPERRRILVIDDEALIYGRASRCCS